MAADLQKTGWHFAFGNLMVFSVVCAITLALDNPFAAVLIG